jgi:hypothetical protein
MRHAVLFSVLSGAAVAAPLLAVLEAAPARPALRHVRPAGHAAEGSARSTVPDAAAPRVVEYRGLRVPVPAGWAVHRLDADPTRCVRYDRHAVYLGRPGPQQDCPARVVGRTEALHIEPAGAGRSARTVVHADKMASLTITPRSGHETRLTLPEAGVAITAVYGENPARLQRVLRAARLSGTWTAGPAAPARPAVRREAAAPTASPTTSPSVAPQTGVTGETGPDVPWVRGKGFDTCTAPSLATMRAWKPSFDVTNIYIGGAARGCAQPNLTASWVREVRAMGYRITPTYVGLQAPCGSRPQRFTARNAAKEGAKAAVDAARKARALGIPAGRPIYYDMEAYDSGKKRGCKAAVLRFVDNWVRRLEAEGYVPCLYSSASSGIRDVGRATGISKPDAIWFANWNGRASVYGDPHLPDHWWSPHRRIKQYRGGHREKHGGVSLNIDSNIADGRVY